MSGSVTEVARDNLMHGFVEYPGEQYPVAVTESAPKILLSNTSEHMRQNKWACKTVTINTSRNIN
jgi:hypothetical protein